MYHTYSQKWAVRSICIIPAACICGGGAAGRRGSTNTNIIFSGGCGGCGGAPQTHFTCRRWELGPEGSAHCARLMVCMCHKTASHLQKRAYVPLFKGARSHLCPSSSPTNTQFAQSAISGLAAAVWSDSRSSLTIESQPHVPPQGRKHRRLN